MDPRKKMPTVCQASVPAEHASDNKKHYVGINNDLARNFQMRPRTWWQKAHILCHMQHTNNPTQPGDTVAGREAHES